MARRPRAQALGRGPYAFTIRNASMSKCSLGPLFESSADDPIPRLGLSRGKRARAHLRDVLHLT